ncbi:MAG: PIG-L family deacetylase [Anaerolineales bacterium]|nr:PIG-L family deacetylase [Anaerolineales bacterium]MCB8950981.1 PIG-L family deacetylase [Ardenticatenales bacterium]
MKKYDAIYLSPHLDDAALSCGGQIAAQTRAGKSVLIVTITAADPPPGPLSDFAQLLHQRWETAANAVAIRRAEDVVAAAALGADYAHWEFYDCIYRRAEDGQPLYPTWNDVIAPQFAAADHPLVATLAARMSQLPAAALIYAPLAVGRHADHQITRAAAEMWAGSRLRYYEDYPYVAAPGALAAVIGEAPGWQPTVIPLTPADLDAKYESIWAYTSQISTFFQDRAELEEKVGGYARQVGGERWWRKTG